MQGRRDRARRAAQKARELAPELARAQTVLGFAELAEINTGRAKKAFRRAIDIDSANPLPRFGLGLATIRAGDLEGGRKEIEIAVALDPENALLRSYLGKAYFDERTTNPLTYFRELVTNFPNQENTLAAQQFAISKQLDPNDPTPWLYDAIRLQSENRPVEALRNIEKSIELNDNRAVYRSRELLDQDQAARGTSLARIYNDLGFEQLGINEATRSLSLDPGNAGAHRFLSDVYATQPRLRDRPRQRTPAGATPAGHQHQPGAAQPERDQPRTSSPPAARRGRASTSSPRCSSATRHSLTSRASSATTIPSRMRQSCPASTTTSRSAPVNSITEPMVFETTSISNTRFPTSSPKSPLRLG